MPAKLSEQAGARRAQNPSSSASLNVKGFNEVLGDLGIVALAY
jgi:hypothetical protein